LSAKVVAGFSGIIGAHGGFGTVGCSNCDGFLRRGVEFSPPSSALFGRSISASSSNFTDLSIETDHLSGQ
jgi:hypothetical protein